MENNTLYYGDCLEVMRKWEGNSIDLIYLDPPFNSKANYNILFGTGKHGEDRDDLAQLTAFIDIWEWDIDAQQRVHRIKNAIEHPAYISINALSLIYPNGGAMLSYLSYMAERLSEMKRLLKSTGSIYLHCDPTASHYLKIIMDDVFGLKNFRNEIIWFHDDTPGRPKSDFPRKHDTIFRYAKGKKWTFNADDVRIPILDKSVERYKTSRTLGGKKYIGGSAAKKGKIPESVWRLPSVKGNSDESIGYPTQKPLILLDRIIKASSNDGDIILDPFCGCGTTVLAASNLNRKWIGIDISTYPLELIRRERMNDMQVPLEGVPKDLDAAKHFAKHKHFEFEKWAVTRLPGFAPNSIQQGDGGIDGRGRIYGVEQANGLCIVQVKGGTPNIDSLRAFFGLIASRKAAIGIFITLTEWKTPSVKKCIVDAGVIKFESTQYNRLVMYSIDEYFRGLEAKLPPIAHPRTGNPLQSELLDSSD